MSGFSGGFLQGLGGGMQQRQDREAKERQLSAMEAMGQQRGNVQPGLSLPMDVGPRGAMPAGQGSGTRDAGLGSAKVGFANPASQGGTRDAGLGSANPERKSDSQAPSLPGQLYISSGTRATYRPSADALNISMDFNASPGGGARGTEVVIPDNASPELRAAAQRYNQMVADFAARNGISDYPIRGVRTRSENGRGVPFTVHTEPFFNDDIGFQEAIQNNPAEFAAIYQEAFSGIPNARLIAPHGVGKDRGAASSIFGDETSYGELIANSLLPNAAQPATPAAAPAPQAQPAAPQPETEAPQTWAQLRKIMKGASQ